MSRITLSVVKTRPQLGHEGNRLVLEALPGGHIVQVIKALPQCGPCNACCVAFPLLPEKQWPEGKRAYVPCKYLQQSDKGCCSIHNDSPAVCKGFLCSYRQGVLGGSPMNRPDSLGLMFYVLSDALARQMELIPPALGIVETTENGLGTIAHERFSRLLRKHKKCHSIAVFPYGCDILYDESVSRWGNATFAWYSTEEQNTYGYQQAKRLFDLLPPKE